MKGIICKASRVPYRIRAFDEVAFESSTASICIIDVYGTAGFRVRLRSSSTKAVISVGPSLRCSVWLGILGNRSKVTERIVGVLSPVACLRGGLAARSTLAIVGDFTVRSQPAQGVIFKLTAFCIFAGLSKPLSAA
jgi:hypothetical protein